MPSVKEQRARIQRARSARAVALDLSKMLEGASTGQSDFKVTVATDRGDQTVAVPREALDRLVEVLEALGDGQDPSVLPTAKESSSGEVANLLGVSRQYVVRLIDDGRLASRRVGNRRRVRVEEALRYLREDDRKRARRYHDRVQAES